MEKIYRNWTKVISKDEVGVVFDQMRPPPAPRFLLILCSTPPRSLTTPENHVTRTYITIDVALVTGTSHTYASIYLRIYISLEFSLSLFLN